MLLSSLRRWQVCAGTDAAGMRAPRFAGKSYEQVAAERLNSDIYNTVTVVLRIYVLKVPFHCDVPCADCLKRHHPN
jgi:hypothetical protein